MLHITSQPDLHIVALRTPDWHLAIWDVATHQAPRENPRIRILPGPAAFSPDAKILAIHDFGSRIQLWNAKTVELLATLTGHVQRVVELEFSPDGRTLVSRSADTQVKLWDVKAGVELLTLVVPFQVAGRPRFSPDGRTLAFLTQFPDKQWVTLLHTALPEDLASEEDP
jgi:WD40 repeat protein